MVDPKIEIAGLQVNPFTKQELLQLVKDRILRQEKTFLTTVYSEFLYHALRDKHLMKLLNQADISVADGIGVIWADYFLSKPLSFKGHYSRILQAWLQVVYTGAEILLNPKKLYSHRIPEKIVGADLIWDLSKLASENNFSIYLLGGRGRVGEMTAKSLKNRLQNLNIVGTSNKEFTDLSILEDLKESKPDLLFVAFNPRVQEKWILENLPNLPVQFAVGLGGTFDYISGEKQSPPIFIRQVGLEWLFRLVTQPSRFTRILNGFWGLILSLVRYKVFMSYPARENVSVVVVGSDNRVLVCKRKSGLPKIGVQDTVVPSGDYWQFPQGGLDNGEELIIGAKRELWEETGIKNVELIAVSEKTHSYLWPNAARQLVFQKYKYNGQVQKTVYFRFTGSDAEIILDESELIDYEWHDLSDIDVVVAPERIEHSRIIQADLKKLLNIESETT